MTGCVALVAGAELYRLVYPMPWSVVLLLLDERCELKEGVEVVLWEVEEALVGRSERSSPV